ncbi:MAG TPA: VWA domain-containing protein, partial [Caulobacteraceae bacterium]|nr:VWA domain-containing protein [Caulobacteraceae bacterium]
MRSSVRVRGFTLLAAAAFMVGSPAAAPTVKAAGVHDGEPSAADCEALGFHPMQDRYEGRQYRRAPSPSLGAIAPMPPPPPAPPPPAKSSADAARVSELAVTGARVQPNVQNAPMSIAAGQAGAYHYGPPAGAIETERYPHATSNPIKRVADDPVSTFSIDVDTASYSNVRRFLNEGQLPPRDAVRVEELVNYFDYAYPRPASAETPFRPFVAVTPSPWGEGKEIIHIGLQGYTRANAAEPPLNLVFLMDTSGSMMSEDRLPLARKALNILVDQLRPQDHVALVAYAGSAGAVLGPTSGRDKLKVRCAIASLESGGSTAGGQGLALAYALAQENFQKGAVNRVILMTDGDFNVGVSDPEKLKDFVSEKRKTGVYLSVYGYGRGNYNDVMMQNLAQNGNGTAAYVDSLEEARKLLRDDFAAQVFPIADDVKIQVEFNPAAVSEYRLIGYETRMLNREDFNNDRVDAGEVGAGASVTALYEITPSGGPTSSDPLRYQSQQAVAPTPRAAELAYLKIRYKLPGGATSRLLERSIGPGDRYARIDAAPEATRWAVAVAAYGQRLRGDPWLKES